MKMVGRRRKVGVVCACALVNAFAVLYAVPLLLESIDGGVPEVTGDRRHQIMSENGDLALRKRSLIASSATEYFSDNRQPELEVGRLPVHRENDSSSFDKIARSGSTQLQFDYLLEPPDVSGAATGHGFCGLRTGRKSRGGGDDVTGRQVSLLIVVCSAVENVDRRNAIRSTWGNRDRLETLGVRLVFVLALPHQMQSGDDDVETEEIDMQNEKSPEGADIGQYVLDEHRRHGDVVQLNFYDHYVNLTLKTLGALRWAATRCPQTTYVAKVDDDVFVNVAAFVRRLADEENRFRSAFGGAASRSFIAGHVIDSAKPVRDRRSKWFTPETMFDGEFYPPYTSGTGYAMGVDVVRRLLSEADNDYVERSRRRSSGTRALFWLEDIYVTGMMAARLDDVRLVHDDRFNAVRRRTPKTMMAMTMSGSRSKIGAVDAPDEDADEKLIEVCWHIRETITVHDLTPNELLQLWNRLRSALAVENLNDQLRVASLCDRKLNDTMSSAADIVMSETS